MPGTS